jgi:hypothetical protein
MKRLSVAIALSLVSAPAAAAPHELRWMLGHWCEDATDGTRTCEQWRIESDGRMQGSGITTRKGKPVERETLRIVPDHGEVYYEASLGGPTTRFRRTASGEKSVTFLNAAHDYPQRIRYWREGAQLVAEIALADGSRAKQWRYSQVSSDHNRPMPDCPF